MPLLLRIDSSIARSGGWQNVSHEHSDGRQQVVRHSGVCDGRGGAKGAAKDSVIQANIRQDVGNGMI
jgi:hypothetical protein